MFSLGFVSLNFLQLERELEPFVSTQRTRSVRCAVRKKSVRCAAGKHEKMSQAVVTVRHDQKLEAEHFLPSSSGEGLVCSVLGDMKWCLMLFKTLWGDLIICNEIDCSLITAQKKKADYQY